MKKNNKKRKNNKKKKAIAIALSSALVVAPATDAVAAITSSSLRDIQTASSNTPYENQDMLNDKLIDEYIDNNINNESEKTQPLPAINEPNQNEATQNETSNPESYSLTKNATFETKTTEKGTFVNIPDVNLRKALNQNLDKGAIDAEITPEDMTRLGNINLIGKGIKDLTGLNAAVNATGIDLQGNPLGSIPNGAFNSLTKLKSIYLAGCSLTEINNTAFVNLPVLTDIRFHVNSITYIPENILSHLPTITFFKIDDNKISSIHPGAFKGLHNLEHLVINNNPLPELTTEHFAPLKKLRNLYLQYTGLKTFSYSILPNPSILYGIDLRGNNLTSIDDNTFVGFTNISNIFLESNKITSISPNAFKSNTLLQNLNLKNNLIETFDISIVTHLQYLKELNLSDNKLKNLSSLSSKTTTAIDATGQKLSIPNPILDNKYDLFTINTSLFNDIKGFTNSPLANLEGVTFKNMYATTLSQDKSSMSFRYAFDPNQNTGKITASYSLPSATPLKHTYSATVEVPVSRDLSLVNYINSTLLKPLSEITLSDATTLIKIDGDFKGQTSDAQKYIKDSCKDFSAKLPEYLALSNNLKKIENYQTLINPTDKASINSFIDIAKSLSPSQCVELKSQINGILTLGLDLIKPKLDKYTLDSLTINDKFEIRRLGEEISAITSSIETIAAKNSTILSLDVQEKTENVNRTITSFLNKILELEAAQHVEELTVAINKVINVSPDNLTLAQSKSVVYIHNTLYALDKVNQDKVLASFPDFSLKMPPLLERSKVMSDIQNYNDFNTSSYDELSKLVQKSFILSQSQKLQLSREINSIFTLSLSLFENDVNKLSLATITLGDKDHVLSLTHNLKSLNNSITEMNKLAGSNIVSPSTQSTAISLLGKLDSLSKKIDYLENSSNVINSIVENVSTLISSSPSELTLNDALTLVSSNNDFNSLADDIKKEVLNKIPDYERKMPALLDRANTLIAIKDYDYVNPSDKASLNSLVKNSTLITFTQRVELKKEINSIFNLSSNLLDSNLSKYSLTNVKVSDKSKIISLKDEASTLLSSLKTVNTNNTASISLLANNSPLLTDASSFAASDRIVSIDVENKLNTISENIDSLLNKIAQLEKPTNPGTTTPGGGSTGTTKPGGGTGTTTGGTSSGSSSTYYPSSSFNKDKLAQTGLPFASLILTLGSASLLGGGLVLFKRRKK